MNPNSSHKAQHAAEAQHHLIEGQPFGRVLLAL
jgi:hypothetical protein